MIQNDSLFLADLRGSNFFNHDSTELLTAPRSVDNGGRFTFLDEKKREEYCKPPPQWLSAVVFSVKCTDSNPLAVLAPLDPLSL